MNSRMSLGRLLNKRLLSSVGLQLVWSDDLAALKKRASRGQALNRDLVKRLAQFETIISCGHDRSTLDDRFPAFYPTSANYWSYPQLTFSAANKFPARLLDLLLSEKAISDVSVVSAYSYEASPRLAKLFDKYGSDKAKHGYAPVYGHIINQLDSRHDLRILEIGLGTNDPDLISTMGVTGKPGASVRAFAEYLPQSVCFGADIDTKTLFTEDRIRTARVDQLDQSSFAMMTETLGCDQFDLIIDDGLHSVEANINTLRFALSSIRPGGWVVIEDIPDRSLAPWRIVAGIFKRPCFLVRASHSNMAVFGPL